MGRMGCRCGRYFHPPTPRRAETRLFPGGDGETQCTKVRSDEVVDGPSLRSQAVAGHAVLPIAEAAGSLSFPYSSSGSGSPLAEGMPYRLHFSHSALRESPRIFEAVVRLPSTRSSTEIIYSFSNSSR